MWWCGPTPAGIVRVGDVATVQRRRRAAMDPRRPTAATPCFSTSTSSPTATRCDRRRGPAKLAEFRPQCQPASLANWYDQSELVAQSAASVRDAILIGVVLASLVLLLFLRNWRVTLIAVIVVPATLAGTALLLDLAGMSFNIMTLGGIAAAVGLVIDDVIVMVEHIVRRAQAARPTSTRPRCSLPRASF